MRTIDAALDAGLPDEVGIDNNPCKASLFKCNSSIAQAIMSLSFVWNRLAWWFWQSKCHPKSHGHPMRIIWQFCQVWQKAYFAYLGPCRISTRMPSSYVIWDFDETSHTNHTQLAQVMDGQSVHLTWLLLYIFMPLLPSTAASQAPAR